MLPMLDNRYLYMGVNAWYKSMALPTQLFKFSADMLDEQVTKPLDEELYDAMPLVQKMQRSAAAGLRLAQRLTQSYDKPAFGITSVVVHEHTVAIEEECVLDMPFCKLLHFKKHSRQEMPKLLLIAPMAGHYATLLRDTVRDSLPYFDVYVTDWVNARDVPISQGAFDMDSYIATLIRCYEYLAPGGFHAVGICQSGLPAYAAVALLEDNEPFRHFLPTTLTVMGSPIDVRKHPTSVDTYASEHQEDWLEQVSLSMVPEGFAGARRLVYPGFLQLTAFVSMNPERHQKSIGDAMRHFTDGNFAEEQKISSFYGEYCSVMDLTAEFYLQTVKVVFQEALLARGKMYSRGRHVDPKAITRTSIFAVEGELDDICGLGQTNAALTLAKNLPASKKAYLMLPGAGHYGLFNGHRYREKVLPALLKFTRSHTPKMQVRAAA